MAGKIFISYRRSETAWAARALFERLWRHFGDRVFIDIEGLSLGTNFTQVIDQHLEGCEVMLALVGETWSEEIQRRAGDDDEPDWVRAELQRALQRGIPVIPVRVEGAPLPRKKDLPIELRGLLDRHGLELHARFFDDQAGRLAREIGKIVGSTVAVPDSAQGDPTLPGAGADSPVRPVTAARPSWMSAEGNDNFGRWAEFTVKGITQRLRWISPGEFWMGSPTTESERRDDEQRHRVTLSRGFWMADSACTQALWQAVVGDNPSSFTGDPQRPVERVSWDHVQQRFLPALANLVGGLKAALPTEAQWEYACRAGTETPFSFGQQISTAQANYDGNYPYADGPKGEYRKETVAVKSLPANAWGLHEMHGNVWEWCADGYGPYGDASAVDPVGALNAATRVVRGGSWFNGAGNLRAARRDHYPPDDRNVRLGFRLCVVSPIE